MDACGTKVGGLRVGRGFLIGRAGASVCVGLLALMLSGVSVRADAFEAYQPTRVVSLPAGSGPFDTLGDGRLVTLVGGDVYVETAVASGSFALLGSLPSADVPSFGAAFLRVSPDGRRIAVGNSGGASFSDYQVGVFELASLGGSWLAANHFDAAWVDNTSLAMTAGSFGFPSVVTVLDVNSADPLNPINPTIINNIGGASAGVVVDAAGNLYTGNGFTLGGPSGTGAVKAFHQTVWGTALSSGVPIDFEASGTLVVDILSASPLGFDGEGNLFVGGGDVAPDADFVALVRASAVAAALGGSGPVDGNDPFQVRVLDPITTSAFNFYTAGRNLATGELYARDFGDNIVYVYGVPMTVPAASQWGLAAMSLVMLTVGTVMIRPRLCPATMGGGS